jgi:hypothetical protein
VRRKIHENLVSSNEAVATVPSHFHPVNQRGVAKACVLIFRIKRCVRQTTSPYLSGLKVYLRPFD